ncbi:ABC transporter ATP-binding protein [Pseudarthrobacter scleromae]|uniref:ABC transporter ATP-binding protein n=1 Tax=Pseudarthrobacter scleromae TaxID=158897 RepID=UPI00362C2BBB
MSEALVHIDQFRMDFGDKTVIRDLSFDVQRGETFGFLGSNGSGKTTTIRALLGIYQPTAGTLHIDGKPFRPEDGGRLGYLPEERGLYKKEKVIDVMTYFGRLKGLDRHAAKTWSLEYLERVALADKAGVQLDKLSGGQQQKVQLGVTIMNDPELLILDEPTKGFDPVNRRLLMDIIDGQKTKGATVVMVTHQMEEVERLCDRVILLKNGTAEAYGTIDDIQNQYGVLLTELRRRVWIRVLRRGGSRGRSAAQTARGSDWSAGDRRGSGKSGGPLALCRHRRQGARDRGLLSVPP